MKTIPFKPRQVFRFETTGRVEIGWNRHGGYFKPLDDIRIVPEKPKTEAASQQKH